MDEKVVTLLIAVAGLLLSIFNTWWLWNRDKVKLRLKSTREAWGGELGNPLAEFSIRVENHSNFPVTIDDAGIVLKNKSNAPRVSFYQTVERDGDTFTKELPIRLERRDSITLRGSAQDSEIQKSGVRYLYVRTACGVVKKTHSSA